ncbi:unnamed protein product [Larinioides sclopetarius]|uniref:Uncharacterized protein n=1 Tax=Larinioides sclopetarius TaxID=280406 RepID=A0AAV2BBZ7_9ARAC
MTEPIEPSSKRSLTVLAVVVACFAVLWPKIFYPMIISILFPSENEEVLTALKTIILEMEDIRGLENVTQDENKQDFFSFADASIDCEYGNHR